MKKYDEILKPEYHDKIFAHTSRHAKPETLIEHSEKTLKYCDYLIDELSLKENFNHILSQLVDVEKISGIFELIRSIVYYHDLGKVNPIFQKEKMNCSNLDITVENLNSNHSFYGKILFDHLFHDDFHDKGFQTMKDRIIFHLLSQTIDRHHTSLKDINFLSKKMNDKIKKDLQIISDSFFNDSKEMYDTEIWNDLYNFDNDQNDCIWNIFKNPEEQEALFYLYKTVYSLLITSDYYATSEFSSQNSKFLEISTIDSTLVDKYIHSFYNYEINKNLKNHIYCKDIRNSNPSQIDDLNKLRTRMLLESDSKLAESISNCPDARVFYLNVPTGGGKTNISIKLALTLLKLKKNIKRIFYVFPFINLIEQNTKVIKCTLNLTKELSSIYSSSTWNVESENKKERLQYCIDNEFLNHPFVVISNVNFFNTFVKSGKTSNYQLVNLANSIVIIDEIQSLNDKHWTLFNDFITYGSKYLNIHFIIMSATLPKIDSLSNTKMPDIALNLLDNTNDFFNHALFKNRVSIEYKHNVNDLIQLLDVLEDELHNDMKKILLVVNTVNTSLNLYKKIRENKKIQNMGFSLCLLNSTILSYRRKEIIEKMKNNDEKIILISTQSVEAGVDIDCDFGIRDFAIFDSIEQIAGRINRNSNLDKNTAKLIITNLKEEHKQAESSIYDGSYRWDTIKQDFASTELIHDFLGKRDFNSYYGKVLEHIKDHDDCIIRESSRDVVDRGIRHLNFEMLNKINIIDQDSISLILDVDIAKKEFGESELKFIANNQHVLVNDKVSGRQIWKIYNEFLKDFQGGYDNRKINTTIWSSVISKFMININNSHGKTKLSDVLDLTKGIPLLKKEFYSYDEGIDRTHLDVNSFCIP